MVGVPAIDEVERTIEGGGGSSVEGMLANPRAAQDVAKADLVRDDALALFAGVFGNALEAPAGVYDELDVKKFLAPDVALVTNEGKPRLVSSTIPLLVETPSDKVEPIDLSLERVRGELQSSNPLVSIDIPEQLGEGIRLPEAGLSIDLVNAPPDRSASILDESVAGFPNIAEDTDFAIAPTPMGVETLTQLRTADSPRTQIYKLNLPNGADLHATKDGGGEVTRDGETLVSVSPPTAIDATGAPVPVDLTVSGDSLSVTTTPDDSTSLPILVDPLFQTYEWQAKQTANGIFGNAKHDEWSPESYEKGGELPAAYETVMPSEWKWNGLIVRTGSGPASSGDHAAWIYTVPRYFSDYEKYSVRPTSFISKMTLSQLKWVAHSPTKSPYVFTGLWDINNGWVSYYSHEGLEGHSVDEPNYLYQFTNSSKNVSVKLASVGIWAMEALKSPGVNSLWVGAATIELSEPEKDNPGFGSISGPSQWVDATAKPVNFTVSDSGLGVYSLTATQGANVWKTPNGCVGTGASPCPRVWQAPKGGVPDLTYNPAAMPQGINYLKVTAEDPLGHVSEAAYAEVKVDHTAPSLSISGSLTEVAAAGESWPTYKLDIEASDGTKTAPQSGIVKTVVKVDGKVVNEVALGCETQSCGSYRQWTLEADDFSAGKHTLDVTATDGVGLSTTKSRTFKLQPAPAPELSLDGSLTEQETLGASRPRYSLEVAASTEAGQKYEAPAPIAAFEFGKGLLGEPTDAAADSKANVWVPRASENVIKGFDRTGKYLKSIGTYSSSGCGLNGPQDLAIDAADNIWVANGNGRVAKYNTKGECVLVFGGTGKGEASIGNASCIGVAPSGNVWVCDWGANKVLRFSAAGSYLGQFGSKGTGVGQFTSPNDIAFGPSGEAWVSDAKRVQKFSSSGQFLSQISENGWGNGEFYGPSGLATDTEGNVFVVETNNNRVEEFNSEGEYRSHFGYYGTSLGQLYWPTGIAIDSNGDFWIADTHNSRIQKWVAPPRPLEPALQAGESGSGEGQLSDPTGIATDKQGNHWVVDTANDRIQKFGPEGEYLDQFGESGSKGGQLDEPHGVAIDAQGDLWVTDSGNGRIAHFTPEGKYVGAGEWVPESNLTGIAIDDEGIIWACDTSNGLIVMFGPEGELYWWIGEEGSASGQLKEPYGLDVDHQGTIWVADAGNNRVQKLGPEGEYLGEIGNPGSGPGKLYRPLDVTIDLDGNLWVSSSKGGSVVEFTPQGEYFNQFGWTGEGPLAEPDGVAPDPDGDVWVVAAGKDELQEWRTPGIPASVSVSVGSQGSGQGQFDAPMDIATDDEGNHWVADTLNNRIQKFGPEGEFLAQFGEKGSGAAQFNAPHGVAIDGEGNLWITDAGNGQIKHFTPGGKYLGQAEKIKNYTPNYPTGIAFDPFEEVIWVTDIGNGRVAKFSTEGEFLWEWIGTSGSGKGQLSYPYGVAADTEGHIWVADTLNNRIQKFDEAGKYLGEFGKEGSGEGSLSHPLGVGVDSEGNVWATDSANGRVKAFDSNGKYLSRFGPGSGEGLLVEPSGLSVGLDGRVWVADRASDRIQAWTPSPADGSTSELTTEISVDGEGVYEGTASCAASTCAMEPSWLLDATAYDEGEHSVEVEATDAFGRATTEELEVDVAPDEVKPTIEAGGELFNAPEGWVEQEAYGLSATASDSGYGVTSLLFKVDGVQLAAETTECPEGGCDATLAKPIDMSKYSGGAHSADLVATDGAGNSAAKHWTINVDPEGHITASEATATLEAVDETANSAVVAPTAEVISEEERADGNDPGLINEGEVLQSAGVPTQSTVSVDSTDGFEIDTADSLLAVKPTSEATSSTTVSHGVAAVAPNTGSSADTIVRPLFNGVMSFTSIRDSMAPSVFSWTVQLTTNQTLKSIDGHAAEVVYDNGIRAFLIAAEAAHDAVGTDVPTTLSVESGNVISLTVSHKEEPYVYPVMSGVGWEGGYTKEYIIGPQDDLEILEEEERIKREKWEQEVKEAEEQNTPPPGPTPEYIPDEETVVPHTGGVSVEAPDIATISKANFVRTTKASMWDCQTHVCEVGAWQIWLKEKFKSNGVKGKIGGEAWHDSSSYHNCDDWRAIFPWSFTVNNCVWIGNNAFYGYGEHFCAQSRYHLNRPWKSDYYAMTFHNYGSGYSGPHWNDDC